MVHAIHAISKIISIIEALKILGRLLGGSPLAIISEFEVNISKYTPLTRCPAFALKAFLENP